MVQKNQPAEVIKAKIENFKRENEAWATFERRVCNFIRFHNYELEQMSGVEFNPALFIAGYLINNIYTDDANAFTVKVYEGMGIEQDELMSILENTRLNAIERLTHKLYDSPEFIMPAQIRSPMEMYLKTLSATVWDSFDMVKKFEYKWDILTETVRDAVNVNWPFMLSNLSYVNKTINTFKGQTTRRQLVLDAYNTYLKNNK